MEPPSLNWRGIYNRLFSLINVQSTPAYFGGPRFITKLQDFDPNVPGYADLLAERNRAGASTSRKDYFYDLMMQLDETKRARFVGSILDEVSDADPERANEIRSLISGVSLGPGVSVPAEMWNAQRLNDYLGTIEAAIAGGDNMRAVTLSYTCLEGFYKAFYRKKEAEEPPNDIVVLARWVWDHLRTAAPAHSPELLALVKSTAHAVDRARNQFSEAHFDGEAARWMALYVRDIVNIQIRLVLHFM